jgi:hypothetical protein
MIIRFYFIRLCYAESILPENIIITALIYQSSLKIVAKRLWATE